MGINGASGWQVVVNMLLKPIPPNTILETRKFHFPYLHPWDGGFIIHGFKAKTCCIRVLGFFGYTICFIRFQSTFSISNQNNLRKRIISILLVFPTLLYLVRGNIIILQTKTSYQSGPFIMGTAWAERKACGLAFGW